MTLQEFEFLVAYLNRENLKLARQNRMIGWALAAGSITTAAVLWSSIFLN